MSEDKKGEKGEKTTSKLKSFVKDVGDKAGQTVKDFGDTVDNKLNEKIMDLMKSNPEAAAAATLAKSSGKKAAKAFAKAAKEKPLTTIATVLSATSGAGLIRSAIYVGAGTMGDKYKDKLKEGLSGVFSDSHDATNDNYKPSNDDDIIEAEFEEIKDDEPKSKSGGSDFKP